MVSLVLPEPMGVAGFTVPRNSPVGPLIRSLAPALAAGTTTLVTVSYTLLTQPTNTPC